MAAASFPGAWRVVAAAALRSVPSAPFLIGNPRRLDWIGTGGLTEERELLGRCFRKSGMCCGWEGLYAKKPRHRWTCFERSRFHGSMGARNVAEHRILRLYLPTSRCKLFSNFFLRQNLIFDFC
jgi:hypothetical protein